MRLKPREFRLKKSLLHNKRQLESLKRKLRLRGSLSERKLRLRRKLPRKPQPWRSFNERRKKSS